MRTTIVKGCLYCGFRLPEHADFCPECGRPIEVEIRVDNKVKMLRTTMVQGCLYCGLQLPEHADFCHECGSPIEKSCSSYATQVSKADSDTEIKGKDDLDRQHEASSDCCDPLAHETTRMPEEHEHVNVIRTLAIVARRNG